MLLFSPDFSAKSAGLDIDFEISCDLMEIDCKCVESFNDLIPDGFW